MRKWGFGALLLVMTAACSVHIGTDGSRTAQAAPPPRQAPAPAAAPPKPADAPPAKPAAGAGNLRLKALGGVASRPRPASTAQAGAAPSGGGRLGAMSIYPGAGGAHMGIDPVNVAKLQQIAKRQPKACGVYEVAPGVWTRIDCQMYKPALKAAPHLSARKRRLVTAHKTLWKPMKSVSAAVKSSFSSARRGPITIRPGGGAAPAAAAAAGGNDPGGIIVADDFPGTVDHRSDRLEGPIKSQGAVGSCTAFALSAVVDNAAIRAGKLSSTNASGATSPNHVWSGYGIPDMGAAADSNIARPLATVGLWGYDNKEACKLAMSTSTYHEDCGEAYGVAAGSWRNDASVVSHYESANAKGIYKIAAVEKMDTRPPNMEEIVGALASGADLWVAFLVDGSKWTNSAMKKGVIPDYTGYSGGHAVTMSGYRDTPSGRQFLIHNSWGTSWGDKGFAWISERMVQKYLYYAYKVKLSGGVQNPTDDDCAPDELVDATTNECALMCADDSRPNNGCGHRR